MDKNTVFIKGLLGEDGIVAVEYVLWVLIGRVIVMNYERVSVLIEKIVTV